MTHECDPGAFALARAKDAAERESGIGSLLEARLLADKGVGEEEGRDTAPVRGRGAICGRLARGAACRAERVGEGEGWRACAEGIMGFMVALRVVAPTTLQAASKAVMMGALSSPAQVREAGCQKPNRGRT